jgi:hypothetical protein
VEYLGLNSQAGQENNPSQLHSHWLGGLSATIALFVNILLMTYWHGSGERVFAV